MQRWNGIEERHEKAVWKNGLEQGAKEIATKLLDNGIDIDFISEVTGLSVDKIKELKKK